MGNGETTANADTSGVPCALGFCAGFSLATMVAIIIGVHMSLEPVFDQADLTHGRTYEQVDVTSDQDRVCWLRTEGGLVRPFRTSEEIPHSFRYEEFADGAYWFVAVPSGDDEKIASLPPETSRDTVTISLSLEEAAAALKNDEVLIVLSPDEWHTVQAKFTFEHEVDLREHVRTAAATAP